MEKCKHVKVTRHGAYIVVDIKANAFVHHMVRNIVGSLIEIGCGNQDVTWMAELLALKDRTRAAATAKADGLYLVSVDYPDHFALPKVPMGPLFWRMTRVNGSPVTKDTEPIVRYVDGKLRRRFGLREYLRKFS